MDHRPRAASELIDSAIALLRRDYARYCLIVAVIAVPWQVARLVAARAIGLPATFTNPDDLGKFAAVGAVALLFLGWIEAAIAIGVAQAYEGRRAEVGPSLVAGARRWVPVMLATLLKYMAIVLFAMVGMFAGLVLAVGVMLAVGRSNPNADALVGVFAVIAMLLGAAASLPPIGWFAAVPLTAALEPLGPVAALKRSKVLTTGLWKHAVGVSALAWVIVALPSLAMSLLAKATGSQIVDTTVQVASSVLLTPFFVAALTVLYYDLRIRKEGYDLELLASQLADAVPDAGPDLPATHGA